MKKLYLLLILIISCILCSGCNNKSAVYNLLEYDALYIDLYGENVFLGCWDTQLNTENNTLDAPERVIPWHEELTLTVYPDKIVVQGKLLDTIAQELLGETVARTYTIIYAGAGYSYELYKYTGGK